MKIAGVDYGDRRIGIAVSDPGESFAFGVGTLTKEASDDGIKKVASELQKLGAERIVVGLPVGMNGGESVKSGQIRTFAVKLEERLRLPVILWDERLTTVMGNRLMMDAGISSRKRRKKADMYAAELILQSYLNSRQARDV